MDGGFVGSEPAVQYRGCSGCGSLSFSQEWYEAFKVLLCNRCKEHEHLISKSKAKEQFLVTDGDLRKLGFVSKPNPHKKDWSAMCLYLQSQVAEVSHRKYGGPEELEDERSRQMDARINSKLQKKRAQAKDGAPNPKLERIKRKIMEESASRSTEPNSETILDESTGGHKRRYAGGVTVDLDEF